MRKFIVCLVLLSGIGLARLALPYAWLPAGVSTISLWHAAEMFEQCSRQVPHSDAKYWLPTAAEIALLESKLWPLLELRHQRGLSVPRRFEPYRRQYIGFTRKGERLIYGNFSVVQGMEAEAPWRWFSLLERPRTACDGGNAFWGIVYKTRSGDFEEPQFNENF